MIVLAGGSRGVGWEVAERLVQHGYPVCALVRQAAHAEALQSLGIQVSLGDAANPDDIATLFRQAGQITTVISTLGGSSPAGQRIDFLGNQHLIDRAVQMGSNHFLLVSSIGVGSSREALPAETYAVLATALAAKEKAEAYLVQSGLTYTILRPGGLTSAPATGRGIVTHDPTVSGLIHRADVAELILACLQSTGAHNQIFSALDSQLIRGDQPVQPYPLR